jgi:putative phage-type endonuclease
MPLIEPAQRTADWLEIRRNKITASVAAACLGLDPYCSRRMAWKKIVSIEDGYQNRHMRWGVQFEAAARLDYEAISGNLVETTGFWIHPTCDWLGASPDGLIGKDGLAEIKCPTVPPEKVPIHHRIQMLIQLACTERQFCDYFSWGANGKQFLARVHRAGIPGLIVRLEKFYREFVLTGVEPPRKARKCRKTANAP